MTQTLKGAALLQAWQDLLASGAKLRQRDAAAKLGVSEAELVAVMPGSCRLKPDWTSLLGRFHQLGEVMALTRNDAAVHEKVGQYGELKGSTEVGLTLGVIDLRIFFSHWYCAFALTEAKGEGVQHSLQFFDRHGEAVHKVFQRPVSNAEAWQSLVDAFTEFDGEDLKFEPVAAKAGETPDDSIDVAGFQQGWKDLTDTHQFFGLTRRFDVSRRQALRFAPEGFTWRVSADALDRVLRTAAERMLSIMVFVGNRGMIQIHTGPVQRIEPMGPWINVLDPGFNLHLRQDAIAEAWVVRKPTDDGIVSSLELLDRDGGIIATLFGERKPGQPELEGWRALLDELPQELSHAA